MVKTENFEKVEVASAQDLRTWLMENHRQENSVWLVTHKKSVPEKYISREAVLDELICFGWIDGIRRKLDDHKTMQLISPRKAQHWAQSYKERAQKLIASGCMDPSGMQAIKTSKANGLWNFMDDVDQLIVPLDLEQALLQKPEAHAFFTSINPSSKRFVLRWLKLTKTQKTRKSRILKLVELSAKGEKLPGS